METLQRLVYTLTAKLRSTQLEERRDGASALDLGYKVLELGVFLTTCYIRLYPRFQRHARPVRVLLLAANEHLRRQDALNLDVPLPELYAVVSRNNKPGDLVARAETGELIGYRGRRQVGAAKGCEDISRDFVRSILY